jgi:hypothetical protein
MARLADIQAARLAGALLKGDAVKGDAVKVDAPFTLISRRKVRFWIGASATLAAIILISWKVESHDSQSSGLSLGDQSPIQEKDMKFTQAMSVAVAAGSICSGVMAQSTAVQWTTASGGNGHWYERVNLPSEITWTSSNAAANALNGHLVTLTSAAEQSWVYQTLVVGQSGCFTASWAIERAAWIGLFQDTTDPAYSEPNGGWKWVTNEPLSYNNWHPGEPNNGSLENVAGMYVLYQGQWNDEPNDADIYCYSAYIIEWSADCNSDGIVDYGQILSGELVDANSNGVPDCCEQGSSCDQLAVGLQAHYLFDGNCLDASGYGRNGDAAGIGYVAGPLGLAGTAASFDGSSSFIQVDGVPIPTDNAFTWALWLRTDGLGSPYAYIIERIAGIGNNLLSPALSVRSNGSLVFGSCCTAGGSETNTPANTVSLGVWAHVACTSSIAGIRRIYVNGALAGEGFAVDYGQQLSKILIGRDRLDCCPRFRGAIDDLRFYSRPLSATEIATLHTSTAPCPGDINLNSIVDAVDLAMVLTSWGTSGSEYPRADVNQDGVVNGPDLGALLGGWGLCP